MCVSTESQLYAALVLAVKVMRCIQCYLVNDVCCYLELDGQQSRAVVRTWLGGFTKRKNIEVLESIRQLVKCRSGFMVSS